MSEASKQHMKRCRYCNRAVAVCAQFGAGWCDKVSRALEDDIVAWGKAMQTFCGSNENLEERVANKPAP